MCTTTIPCERRAILCLATTEPRLETVTCDPHHGFDSDRVISCILALGRAVLRILSDNTLRVAPLRPGGSKRLLYAKPFDIRLHCHPPMATSPLGNFRKRPPGANAYVTLVRFMFGYIVIHTWLRLRWIILEAMPRRKLLLYVKRFPAALHCRSPVATSP